MSIKTRKTEKIFSIKDPIIGDLNHILDVVVVRLANGNILHILDVVTGFQNGCFIQNIDAEPTWKRLRGHCINVYAVSPCYIHSDAGKNFIYSMFKNSATTLVYGVYAKIPGARHRGSVIERAHIIGKCTKLVTKLNDVHTLKHFMKTKHAPSIGEINKVQLLPPGHVVLVYQEKERWKKYTLVRVKVKEVDVMLRNGMISTFSISSVCPYYSILEARRGKGKEEIKSKEPKEQDIPDLFHKDEITTRPKMKKDSAYSSIQAHHVCTMDSNFYRESRMDEIKILSGLQYFQVTLVKRTERHKLYRAMVVDKVKPDGNIRSRCCDAACKDRIHGLFTAAQTIRRTSLHLLLGIATSKRYTVTVRNNSKAFVMSHASLRPCVFMQPPRETGLQKENNFKVLKQAYGTPESPMHWFKTYTEYHTRTLSTSQITLGSCLLFRRNENQLEGLAGSQVDDTISVATSNFYENDYNDLLSF